jgi:dethiobiotin synthetase
MTRGAFVTGTDTGVGKTLAACALLHALAARDVRAIPMKPIAAGVTGAMNEDTAALIAAAGRGKPEDVTPVLLREPMAPHIAAAREGVILSLAPVTAAFERLRTQGDFIVVEGVGGFKVPLADGLDTVDMARAFALPVVLVVGMRLGCLNHALLTADAIDAAGLRLAGWIANHVDAHMLVADENVEALRTRLHAPLLGRLPFDEEANARAVSRHLDVGALL